MRTLLLRCPRLQAPRLQALLQLADTPGLSLHVWKKAGPAHREASRREQPQETPVSQLKGASRQPSGAGKQGIQRDSLRVNTYPFQRSWNPHGMHTHA